MAYVIGDGCLECGACLEECPTGSITAESTGYTIHYDTCIECGICAETCPIGNIKEQ